MTTDLGLLTKAAEKWDQAAKDFESVQTVYDSQVRNIATDGSWTGVSSMSAHAASKLTYEQYAGAVKEARAIASLLRDAQAQFTELRGKLKHEVAQAVEAGMKVSDDGTARFDFEKASKALADAARHDPDLHTTESHWTQSIGNLVQAFDDADQGVKLALTAATKSSDVLNGGVHGFNAKAEGDIEKVEGRRQAELARLTHWDDKQLAEMQRLERDNKNSAEFSRTFLAELGADGTIDFANRLRGLTGGDKRQEYEQLQNGLATNISAATRDVNSPFYEKWREGLRNAGTKNYGSETDPYYGYQSFVSLMEHHDRYGKQFLHDLGNDIIDTEKKHKDIWTQWRRHPGIASDPLDHLLGIMGKDPATATSFLDPGADGKNDHLKYLLKDRNWPKIALNGPGALLSQDDPAARIGLGAALEAAATGEVPGTKHTLGGHTEAEARVMHDTLRTLNEGGKGDKLAANLRAPLGNMLTDYTSDTHEIMSLNNPAYTGAAPAEGADGRVWKDSDGTVRMAVHPTDLARIMRGVANDPAAFGTMYRAEHEYAAQAMTRSDFNDQQDRDLAIRNASSAFGFYDGVRADVVFDKRDTAIQWARDVSHAVTGSSGAALNFVPAKLGGEDTPKGIKIGADVLNRITDFAMYEWTKEQISEATAAAGKESRQDFYAGQLQVENLVREWGKENGHTNQQEALMRNLVGEAKNDHYTARQQAVAALGRDH
ncbi:hypothetical protein ABZY03_28615 [Streptomyces klenkii]|uniref:hypothetical protein n=1 Tax=Streptomyces klenkii TaxID=1420899 RepID=UPI0033BCFFC9